MILAFAIAAIFVSGLMALTLAFPAGLFLMLLLHVLHHEYSSAIPTMSYLTAYTVALLVSLTASFIFFRVPLNSED